MRSPRGRLVWSQVPYAFLDAAAPPPEINPSLWRRARLNRTHGLFEVVPGVHQARGLDLANMTLVECERGVIVIDALTATVVAATALALYRAHRGERPVTGVIYTHTHSDHWGGMPAVVDPADVLAGKVPLIAPEGFMHHAVAENAIAGPAMLRRSHYQFGPLLHKRPRGHIDNGLGKDIAIGGRGLVAPNDNITRPGERRPFDGVQFVFQLALDTEAPAEMHFRLPRFLVLNLAENATRAFHNLLPFRGAQTCKSLDWSKYIHEALTLWGGEADAQAGQHNRPVWGNANVRAHLEIQRDLYRFVHDQTVQLMNLGHTPQEIAERLELPPAIAASWHARGYYGALRHNAKAIYQHYLGWYDANPANLDPHEPAETGRRMVEYMGGADAVVAKARADFERGEFRWVVQVLNYIVFADPGHADGRALPADA